MLVLQYTFSRTQTGDGTVNFEEFVDILERMSEESYTSSAEDEERELRDAFRVFDKHNRGFITASDLRAVLGCLGENLCESDSQSSHHSDEVFHTFIEILNSFLFCLQSRT